VLAVLALSLGVALAFAAPVAAAPSFVAQWGARGQADGQFIEPYGVATDAAGNLYVADSLNHRIQKFSPAGAFLGKWGTLGTGAGQFNEPRAVAVGPSGSVYVTISATTACRSSRRPASSCGAGAGGS
jgi:DNA-binding beta-propeller fold protein YncE